MFWIRYNKKTGLLTGWSDTKDMPLRSDEAIIKLAISKPLADDYEQYTYQDGQLKPSGKSVKLPRNLAAELDNLTARVNTLEEKVRVAPK